MEKDYLEARQLLVKYLIIFSNKYGFGWCQKYRLSRIEQIQLRFAGREEAEAMWKQDLKTIGLLTAGLGAVGAAIFNSR